jgi:hypothetical protein
MVKNLIETMISNIDGMLADPMSHKWIMLNLIAFAFVGLVGISIIAGAATKLVLGMPIHL